jgi:hypothetical protein
MTTTDVRPRKPSSDDMDDTEIIAEYAERHELVRLTDALRCIANQITPSFREADAEVGRCKRAYMLFAQWAAWLGAAAVFFAILQLSELGKGALPRTLLPWVEFAFAGAAVGVAIVGLGGRRQQLWFIARHRAEQLRLLKFKFLTQPDLWSHDVKTARDYSQGLPALVEAIRASSFADVEHWVTRGSVPLLASEPSMSGSEWTEFVAYYRWKRLQAQIDYLRIATESNQRRNDRTRTWPSVLFFGSVAFVLAHFCVELVGWRTGSEPDAVVARIALLLAASLPVWGAGIRVIRGVFEYGRNASRYESTHNALLELSERLRRADNPGGAFREIGFCEQAMEADLREWVRLMIEAEWFG